LRLIARRITGDDKNPLESRGNGTAAPLLLLLAVCASLTCLSFAGTEKDAAPPGNAVAMVGRMAVPQPGDSEEKRAKANQIKAVCLFRFASYVKWPAQAFKTEKSPIVIGILGKDPFGSTFDKIIEGERVHKRRIELRRFESFSALKAPLAGKEGEPVRNRLSELNACHILFVSSSEKENLPGILKRLADSPTLTAGDTPQFADMGGAINFVIVKNRVRFEINLATARKKNLVISSRVLDLAIRLIGKEKTVPEKKGKR
jgi:hypothetical protein